jgi:hypothetical protein
MNKEIDWHGQVTGYPRVYDVSGRLMATEDGCTWRVLVDESGAWPKPTAIPVGWDERDALV